MEAETIQRQIDEQDQLCAELGTAQPSARNQDE